MLLEKLPAKMIHHLRRSITWTEIDAASPLRNSLRRFVKGLSRPSRWIVPIGVTTQRQVGTMTQHWDGREGRWGERVKVDIPVQLSADVFAGADGCMRNLSLSGALVRANVDWGLHSLIEVSITMPSRKRAEVVTAYVSRRLQGGIGIEWCEFAPIVIKDLLRSPAIRLPL